MNLIFLLMLLAFVCFLIDWVRGKAQSWITLGLMLWVLAELLRLHGLHM